MCEVNGGLSNKTGDTAGALESYRSALTILETWLPSEPASVEAQRFMAIHNAKLAGVYAKLALTTKAAVDKQRESWREARAWYGRSLNIWRDIRDKGTLSDADASQPDEVTREIAKCDAELTK